MITALLAGVAVPQWDRELVGELSRAVAALKHDQKTKTTWPFGVMNDEGAVYRRIVAEGSVECATLVEWFFRGKFRLVHMDGQPVMRKLASGP